MTKLRWHVLGLLAFVGSACEPYPPEPYPPYGNNPYGSNPYSSNPYARNPYGPPQRPVLGPDGRYGPPPTVPTGPQNPSWQGGFNQPPTQPQPPITPQGPPTRTEYPVAERTANPNQVISPFPPYNVIDVEGFRSGQLARDPSNQRIFRVP